LIPPKSVSFGFPRYAWNPGILSNNKARELESKGKLMLIRIAPVAKMNTSQSVAQKFA
tara:strand:+ start:1409 stop:1582 length:174 start_codon:yes stop_codon:yes gene_type:complete